MPQVKRIEFRIGIHVGDIIVDDNDIFGDGVNIAARLEGIAEPGGVCISDDAQRQVRYFGSVKSIQEEFVSKLDPVSRKRFNFVELPSQIEKVPFDFEPFSEAELKIYQSYSAPKY
jgi:class 3 adenylate cyclase